MINLLSNDDQDYNIRYNGYNYLPLVGGQVSNLIILLSAQKFNYGMITLYCISS